MVNYLVAKGSPLSNFNPGSRVGAIIEAVAWELAKGDLETWNGYRSAILEAVYNQFGFQRLPGLKSTGIIRIEHTGHVNPVNYPIFTIDLFGQRFRTVEPVTIAVGDTYTTVEAVAEEPGRFGNIVAGSIDTAEGRGTIVESIEPNTRIWNPADFQNGTDQETDSARLKRFQLFITSLGRSTLSGIKFGALSVPGVVGAVVQNNINPYTQLGETGWVNVYISDGTSSPSPALLQEVFDTLQGIDDDPAYPGYVAGGVSLYVDTIGIYAVSVQYQLTVREGSSLTDTEATEIVEAAAMNYVNSLPVGQDVLFETLEAKMLTAHPDFYRINIISPVADIVVPNTELARIGGTGGGSISGSLLPREVPG